VSTTAFDEVVVTASRIPQSLRSIGTSLTVLDSSDLQLRGNLAVQDILRQTPAVSVTNSGGAGKVSALRIRGEEGYRTLLILDGIRLLDPSAPQTAPQFEHMLSSNLARVEILRGPQGLAYGADAGGVVNMTTLPASRALNVTLDAQGGAYGTQHYSGTLTGGGPRADFVLLLSDFATDGFNAQAADTALRDADGYANTTLHGRAGFALADTLRLDVAHRQVRGDSAFDGCFHPSTFAVEHDCADRFALDATRAALTRDTAHGTHTLAYATTQTERRNVAAGLAAFSSEGALERWEYLGHVRDLPGFALVFGADHEDARNNDAGRNNTGLFTEVLSEFSANLHISAGLRHDDNDDFGTNTSYRLSSAYLVDAGTTGTLKFKASHGTGLRAPSPYEVAYNSGSFSYPPASLTTLQQESSEGSEAGVEYLHATGLHLDAVYFTQDVNDFIYFDLAAFSGYLQQQGSSTSRGVELAGSLPLSSAWHLQANYTWNETQQPNGLQRPRRPEHQYNLGASWQGMQQRLTLNAFYRAARAAVDDTSAGRVALDDYGVLDLSGGYRVNEHLQLFARVENLLDTQYEELSGYNTAARAGYLGFRLNYRP
jgi:vitamin B12 transporter